MRSVPGPVGTIGGGHTSVNVLTAARAVAAASVVTLARAADASVASSTSRHALSTSSLGSPTRCKPTHAPGARGGASGASFTHVVRPVPTVAVRGTVNDGLAGVAQATAGAVVAAPSAGVRTTTRR